MQDQVLISVVTVSYNAVSTIEQTILSVINQTYPHIEYIIIDGGSTDGTVDVIKKYADKITYWVSEPDKGIYDAMNKGIAVATGEWINFMNSGDSFYSKDSVESAFNQIDCNVDYIVGTAIFSNGLLWKPVKNDFSFADIFNGGEANHQASFIKKNLFDKDKYDDSLKILSDEKFFFEKVFIENKTYLPLDVIVSKCDANGVSNQPSAPKIIAYERECFFGNYISQRILVDYKRMTRKSVAVKIYKYIKQKICNVICYLLYIKCSRNHW